MGDDTTPQRRTTKRSRKKDDGGMTTPSPKKVTIYHDLFETKNPANEEEAPTTNQNHTTNDDDAKSANDNDGKEEPKQQQQQQGDSDSHNKRRKTTTEDEDVETPAPPITIHTNTNPSSSAPKEEEKEKDSPIQRQTQLLCNAWAKQPSGLTFTQLLQLVDNKNDKESSNPDEPPRLSHEQLPNEILITLNADVFETTKFKLTRDGTYQQILTRTQHDSCIHPVKKESPSKKAQSNATNGKPTTAITTTIQPTATKHDGKFTTTTTTQPATTKHVGKLQSEWIEGSIRVAMAEDANYLNKLHQWVRQNIEFFSAQKGGRKGISAGRVGIRCIHCQSLSERFPGTANGIWTCISTKFVSHFQHCTKLPMEQKHWFLAAMQDAESFILPKPKNGLTSNPYSRVAARRIGIVEIPHDGLRFSRELDLDPLEMEVVMEDDNKRVVASPKTERSVVQANVVDTKTESFLAKAAGEKDSEDALSRASDKARCSDYFFLCLRQAVLCHATTQEAVLRNKRNSETNKATIFAGFTGFCCRWCQQTRTYPSAEDNVSNAVLSPLVKHLTNSCEAIPGNVRSALISYKASHAKQHVAIPKSLRDELVSDLWSRLRSNDRNADDATKPPSK